MIFKRNLQSLQGEVEELEKERGVTRWKGVKKGMSLNDVQILREATLSGLVEGKNLSAGGR